MAVVYDADGGRGVGRRKKERGEGTTVTASLSNARADYVTAGIENDVVHFDPVVELRHLDIPFRRPRLTHHLHPKTSSRRAECMLRLPPPNHINLLMLPGISFIRTRFPFP